MNKRDLKADLGIARGMKPLNTSEYYEGISLETAQQYMMAAEGWPHAIEMALELEEELTRCGNTLVELTIALKDARKRADKAEALARELVHHLDNTACVLASRVKLARKDLIGRTRDGGTQWASDVLGEVKQVVTKAKEVLGDE